MKNRLAAAFLIVFILILTSCVKKTGANSFLRKELSNHGTITLSGDNPYVASNLFVAKEMEQSELLNGFVRYRGTPDAIQINRQYLKPLKIHFYYLDRNEAYVLDEGAENEWIILGPKEMPTYVMLHFADVAPSGPNAPLVIQGQIIRDIQHAGPSKEPPRAMVTSAKSTLTGKSIAHKPSPAKMKKRTPAPSQSKIDRASSGDIIHHISIPGETLRIISRWYTGSVENADRLARINNLKDPNILFMGQTLRIPRYLLQNERPLPKAEVDYYRRPKTIEQLGNPGPAAQVR